MRSPAWSHPRIRKRRCLTITPFFIRISASSSRCGHYILRQKMCLCSPAYRKFRFSGSTHHLPDRRPRPQLCAIRRMGIFRAQLFIHIFQIRQIDIHKSFESFYRIHILITACIIHDRYVKPPSFARRSARTTCGANCPVLQEITLFVFFRNSKRSPPAVLRWNFFPPFRSRCFRSGRIHSKRRARKRPRSIPPSRKYRVLPHI